MICTRLFAVAVLAAVPALGWSYDSAFTLTFEQATDAEGFTEANGNTVIVAGENVAVDSPAYATPPQSATGYNGTKWLRVGADVQANGVSTLAYDGRAGGTTTDATDYIATVDVYINPAYPTDRFQVALMGRYLSGNAAPEIFYSRNTPTTQDGYGWRYGGLTTQYNAFTTVTETAARWVRFKTEFKQSDVIFSVDRDLDNVYDLVSPKMTTTAIAPGKIALQAVINTAAGLAVPNQYAYFDNLTYIPLARVSEWSLY